MKYLKKALSIRQLLFGETHPQVATTYLNIAASLLDQGNADEGLRNLNKALDVWLEIFGEKHYVVAMIYNNMGRAYVDKTQYHQALEYYNKALELRLAIFGVNHPHVGDTYAKIGQIYTHQGSYDRAMEYFQKSLEIDLAVLGETHPEVGSRYENIAGIHYRKQEYDKAVEYLLKARDIYNAKYGEASPRTANILVSLATVYEATGKDEDARRLFERIAESLEDDVSDSGLNLELAAFYTRRNNFKKSLEYLSRALKAAKKYGNPRFLANTYITYAELEQARGNRKEAEEFADKALALIEGLELKPVLIDALNIKGKVSGERGYLDRALALAREIGDRPREAEILKYLN
jgi:tetratricopeptide (TPR) repeat protein